CCMDFRNQSVRIAHEGCREFHVRPPAGLNDLACDYTLSIIIDESNGSWQRCDSRARRLSPDPRMDNLFGGKSQETSRGLEIRHQCRFRKQGIGADRFVTINSAAIKGDVPILVEQTFVSGQMRRPQYLRWRRERGMCFIM